MEHIFLALNVVLPVFAVISIGWFFRWRKLINEEFVNMAMKVIFSACLPSMLFIKISQVEIDSLMQDGAAGFVGYAAVMTLLVFFIGRLVAKLFIADEGIRGTFVHGAFRSNYIILGYAILFNLFGEVIVGRMALLLIVIIPMYNILAIWVLTDKSGESRSKGLHSSVKKILTNPMIISVVLGFAVNMTGLKVPVIVNSTMVMLGSIGTPLGLLGIGAYMNFSELKTMKTGLVAAALKVFAFPLLVTVLAVVLGFTYLDTTILFVLFASPAAITSFIMSTALGGDGRLAANIVILSTLMSMVTFILGLTLLGIVY